MTKKIRFEVFKRDGFVCQYCGRRPPDVVLEVDHITPICKGGKDIVTNLLTACFDCNRGKAGTPIDKQTHQEAAAVLREKRDQLKAYNRLVEDIDQQQEFAVDRIQTVLFERHNGTTLTTRARRGVVAFLDKLGQEKVVKAAGMAADRKTDPDVIFRYFCGICWNWIRGEGL